MSSTKLRVKELLRERRWTTKVLAEKTGMSESYLTHIKNGTRRWNEDALKKLSSAFELTPTDLFECRNQRTDFVEGFVDSAADSSLAKNNIEASSEATSVLKMKIVPVVGKIPSSPSPYTNQKAQVDTGYSDTFVPVFGCDDDSVFCHVVEDSSLAPRFLKGDMLIISPAVWTKSGDIVAVEYETPEKVLKKDIAQVNYMEDFVVLESVNHNQPPVALLKGKDSFRVIGKVIWRYQKTG